jgi:hypothetical protein
MFGSHTVRVEKQLWERVKRLAELAGYSSPDELVTHVLERELAKLDGDETDESIRKKLKGLGYIE